MAGSIAGTDGDSNLASQGPQFRLGGASFIALLIFTQLPGVLAYTVTVPLLAGMAQDLAHDQASAYLVKLVAGILGPAMAIGAPLGGWLADKFDRRGLIIALGVLYVLAGVAPWTLQSLELIVSTRFLTGLAAGALMAIGMTMVGDYLPEERRAGTIGMLSALNMIASLITLPAAGFVGDAGWRLAFLLYALGTPVILLAIPRSLPVPSRAKAAAGLETDRAPRFHMPYLLLLLALAIGIILTIPGIYVSFHLETMGLGKVSTVGLLMMLNSLIAAVFSSIFGRATARISSKLIFLIGFSTIAAGLIMLALASGYALAIPALLLMGAGMGWLVPALMARAVASVDEGRRGRVVGMVQGASSIAPLFGIALLEPLMPSYGTEGIFLIVGSLSAVCFLVMLAARNGK